jgi:phosphopantothenate synthetase
MAIDIRYENGKRFLTVVVKGQLSHEEYKTTMDRITQSEQYPADINALWDVRDQDFRNVTASTVKSIIAISRQYSERGSSRVAIIVKDNLAFGMMRMYELTRKNEEYDLSQIHMVFKDYSEGEKWLLDESPVA